MNPRIYEQLRRILVEGSSTIDVIFCYFFHYFWHFKCILQTQWFISMNFFLSLKCLYCGSESLCSLNVFHLNRFRNQISPPNVFLRKFQHLFSTLNHYNLSIYTVKWPQICSTPSTTCKLQYCTVEIFIPYSDFDFSGLQRQAVFKPGWTSEAEGLRHRKNYLKNLEQEKW